MSVTNHSNLLKALHEKREELKREIDALDVVIVLFENSAGSTKQAEPTKVAQEAGQLFNQTSPVISPNIKEGIKGEVDQNFPKGADVKSQILYVLQKIGKALRYPELQDEYTKLSNSRRIIRKDLIDLRKDGSLVAIKYNNNFAQTYQGLPEWIAESEIGLTFSNDFLDIDSNKFPTGVHRSEKVIDNKA